MIKTYLQLLIGRGICRHMASGSSSGRNFSRSVRLFASVCYEDCYNDGY